MITKKHVADLVAQASGVITRIRSDDDYIAQAVAHGKMNPKLRAICIANAENWEWLSRSFPDFQLAIDELARDIVDAAMPVETDSIAVLELDAMRAFHKIGMHIAVEVDVDNDAMPVNIYGVFEVRPDLKFAI
jgi:hypothetical protein